ncbi:hypothetical protein [Marinicella gelatinilytica]|uniref:hypothetical protein n=1 Tax=Marinicella gelatinilytica TaxID=2996017 RepID=UPI002260B31A|nr:hypothetical protein [Marinicella gelatinilytica]MCX7545253.1 hypothetical protein [Marinicella gelatinilytica]
MSATRIYSDTPPFWRRFGFFFNYIRQEKLFFQITLLASFNLLLAIPSLIIQLLVQITLFLASYKLAFEVLSSMSRGEFQYRDSFAFHVTELIGFKALGMPVLQLLLFIFVFRYDPTTGAALLLLTTILTPAFLMILAESQSLISALNPLTQIQIATRIGGEYVVLTLFFVLLSAINLLFRYFFNGLLPPLIEVVLVAWVLYFLLVFSFTVIGYVMYRHADSIGHETMDNVEDRQSSKPNKHSDYDPIKQRIEDLLAVGDGQQALKIIKEVSEHEQRHDLDRYRLNAQHLAKQQQKTEPAEHLAQLVAAKRYREAMIYIKKYHSDGHLIKAKNVVTIQELITYNAHNNNHEWVIRFYKQMSRSFPKHHQDIVDAGHRTAQSLYQSNQSDRSRRLLERLIRQYQQTADVSQLKSYLIGIKQKQKKPTN